MWKSNQAATTSTLPTSSTVRGAALTGVPESSALNAIPKTEKSSFGKGLTFVGQLTASEPLFIDGNIEGSITLPGDRVTVGRNGIVTASINARDILVLGTVCGNVSATGKVEIRAEGSLTGDISTGRILIEDGAFFKGKLDVRQDESSNAAAVAVKTDRAKTPVVEQPDAAYVVLTPTDARKRNMRQMLQSA